MEPRIQYAKTKDGVSIAFWTLGEGAPLVHLPFFFSDIQVEWQFPECRRWYERLAQKRKLVRYDCRGVGLSERDVADFSVDALLMDIEALADRLHMERFAVLGLHHSGPAAIAYAARHPEQVSHLLLWCTYTQSSDWLSLPQLEAIRGLVDKDWAFFTEATAHTLLGWSAGEPARRYAALMRDSVSLEFLRTKVIPAVAEFDVMPLLAQVRSPTLVLNRRLYTPSPVDVGRGLASRIPDARLVLLEGESGAPYLGDTEAVLQVIDDFLGEGVESARAPAEAAPPGGLRTILFTDIVGHTAMMRRLGDEKGRDVLREHERITREALKSHGGTEVKTMGDGFLASFSSVTRAVECAIALQQAFARHNETVAEPVHTRVGLNAGEPIEEEGDIFGETVILAARVAAQAEGGEILASLAVRELCAGKGFLFADRGGVALRGFEDPVRLYEVRWREET
jgi:class 3 adenylate cyclase